jgi:hypothetical protein
VEGPESLVLRACLDYLRLRGHLVIRVNGGGFRTERGAWVRCTDTPGTPDILGISREGKPLAVEAKSARGRLSAFQEQFREAWTARGGLYVTARHIGDLQKEGL